MMIYHKSMEKFVGSESLVYGELLARVLLWLFLRLQNMALDEESHLSSASRRRWLPGNHGPHDGSYWVSWTTNIIQITSI